QLLWRTFNAEQKRIFGLEQTSPLPAPKPWITPFFLFAAIVILSFVLLGAALGLGLPFLAGPVLGALAAIWLWWVRRKRRVGID
ncbi:MAG TPA: hypothetical protein VGX70_02070, partial [Gemmataceae bacterium]|nr:hypothetical protein [Gemmataceae bacterium]